MPFTRMAVSEFGNVLVANMIALGALAGLSGLVGREAVKQAVLSHMRQNLRDLNLRALERGFAEADRLAGAPYDGR